MKIESRIQKRERRPAGSRRPGVATNLILSLAPRCCDCRFAHGRAPSKSHQTQPARAGAALPVTFTFYTAVMAIFETERSLMFAYVRLKSLMFAFFEKKYFFPGLWSQGTGTQWVGQAERVGKWSYEVLESWERQFARRRASFPRSAAMEGGGGKRRIGTRAFSALGGRRAGKQPGFSHIAPASTRLFPHYSTQVVDFQRIYTVRVFPDANLASQARYDMGAPEELFVGAKCGPRKFGLLRESSRSFTKVRTDQARKSSMLRIVTGGTHF